MISDEIVLQINDRSALVYFNCIIYALQHYVANIGEKQTHLTCDKTAHKRFHQYRLSTTATDEVDNDHRLFVTRDTHRHQKP